MDRIGYNTVHSKRTMADNRQRRYAIWTTGASAETRSRALPECCGGEELRESTIENYLPACFGAAGVDGRRASDERAGCGVEGIADRRRALPPGP